MPTDQVKLRQCLFNLVVPTAKDITVEERAFLESQADQILTKGNTASRERAEQLRGLNREPEAA